jgi:hypothetical protein
MAQFRNMEDTAHAAAWFYITLPIEVGLQIVGARANLASLFAEAKATANIAVKGSVWSLNPFRRGFVIDVNLAANLPLSEGKSLDTFRPHNAVHRDGEEVVWLPREKIPSRRSTVDSSLSK